MSKEYDNYLVQHKQNVSNGFQWMVDNLPVIMKPLLCNKLIDLTWQTGFAHDASKTSKDEYDAYDAYFYGKNRSFKVVQDFKMAWLHHIHNNQHHWQHWVLMNDDPVEAVEILEIPEEYIIEMICDWWSFSWTAGDLTTIFTWYEEHKDYIQFHPRTRSKVEGILHLIRTKLEGNNE